MTTSVRTRERLAQGWGISLILHGLFITAALPLFRQLPVTIHPAPFRWDVALVESPNNPDPTESPNFASFVPESSSAIVGHQQSLVASTDIPQPLQESTSPDRATTVPSHEQAPETRTPRTVIVEPFKADNPSTLSSPSAQEATTPTSVTAPDRREIAPEQIASSTTVPLPSGESSIAHTITKQEPEPVSVSPAQKYAVVPENPSASNFPRLGHPASIVPASTGPSLGSRPDYGWLQQAVLQRLEELKRSSRPLLDDSSRLKVLVKAVVSNAGELMEASVAKSSGLERVDQEAMSLVQRVFPMQLDHRLDRPQIVMRISITYSRD